MDLVNQNKFKNVLIILLLVLNIIAMSVIWMQTSNKDEDKPVRQEVGAPQSVKLMKEVLDLSDDQTKQFEKLRTDQMSKSKKFNDELNNLKKQLADELVNKNPDTTAAKIKAQQIGDMQAKVELIRFNNFKDLLKLCTPEQKEKLKPIMMEIFGKKPPKEDFMPGRQSDERPPKREERDSIKRAIKMEKRNEAERVKPGPPSMEEKLNKYSERLSLSDDQIEKMKSILSDTKEKGEALRRMKNPDQNFVESEREKLKQEEDEKILRILTDEQKNEFSKMIMKRKDKSK